MIKYFGWRFLTILPKLLIITVLIFIGLQLVPGDPITSKISPEVYSKLNPVQIEEMRDELGLNDNIAVQYFRWLFRIFKGDFGYSLNTGGPIREVLFERLHATFELIIAGIVIATFLGILIGVVSAIKQNSFVDYLNTTFGMIGVSVPEFFFGLSFITIFSFRLKWLPTGGRLIMGKEAFFDRIEFLVLPTLCLIIAYIATLMRFTRGSMLDVLNKEYIKTARSKGISEINVNIKHVLRNALIPIMCILMWRIPMLVGGAIIIESVFNFPGMGSMLVTAIGNQDMPLVMITTLVVAIVILLTSFFLDIVTVFLDPRIIVGKR